MDKNIAKAKIRELVEKYQEAKKTGKINSYSEEETKRGFIEPLFEALGWNISDKNQVSMEEYYSGGRVDYGFYLDGIVRFYVEAKSLRSDLNREEYARQAVNYSWNKGVTWSVLTDFEGLKVLNAENVTDSLFNKQFFQINWDEYLDRFDELWLLSKESLESNLLDREAEKVGKRMQRVPVSELLYKDLNACRNMLINALRQWNNDKKITNELLEEGVQKLIDRLIFIRVLEDRGIEGSTLRPLVRAWESRSDKNKVTIYESMISKFRELDEIYNSNLFDKHPFEKWQEHSEFTEKVVEKLYGKKGYYEYDFKVMPADILGNVYENYLGHILSQSKKGIEITKDPKKRKEQGIYFTPTFIVDYIVENSIKPVLDKCKSFHDLKKIKVLDPACGSGSFLLKALEVIDKKYDEFDAPKNPYRKFEIVTENLFGVDLDEQAVEIARLNLLVAALDEKMKMPSLDKNIKNGNSLISGTDKELGKYFGKNYRERIPFNWDEEFPEVFRQGGFDAIIGNPPWVSLKGKFKSGDFSKEEIGFLTNKYKSNTYAPNLYEMFIHRSIGILKENGCLGFIVPDRFAANQQFIDLRKKILEDFTLKAAVFGVDFPGIIADTMIVIFSKSKPNSKSKLYVGNLKKKTSTELPQSLFLSQDDFSIYYVSEKILDIFNRILSNPKVKNLSQIAHSTSGCGAKTSEIHLEKNNDKEIRIVKGENIGRYGMNGYFWFEFKKENLTGRTRDKEKLGEKSKILIRKTGADLIATFDDSGIFPEQSLYFIYGVEKEVLYYLLTIINSKLMNVYYKNFAITNRDSTPQLKNIHLDKFPVIKADKEMLNLLVDLCKKMIFLNKQLKENIENSNEWEKNKSQIELINKQIDHLVYKLYGLTPEEIKIVEDSIG